MVTGDIDVVTIHELLPNFSFVLKKKAKSLKDYK